MADTRKRPAFQREWWEKVNQFIEEHPETGFEPGEQKQFIKWVLNKFMENDGLALTEEKVEEIKEKLDL